MTRLLRLLPILTLSAALIGCGPDSSGNGSAAPATPGGGAKKGAKTAAVEVTEVSFDGLDAALKEQKGTVVYVDFWALSCVPCVNGFPHFVELHKKYADRGLTCISVSMDKQDEDYAKDRLGEKVLDFLKEKGATFPNFVLNDPDKAAESLKKRFNKGEGIPFAALFDRDGKRIGDTKPDNPDRRTLAQLDKMIEAELAK